VKSTPTAHGAGEEHTEERDTRRWDTENPSKRQAGRQAARKGPAATLSSLSVESTTQGCGFCSVQEENDEGNGSDYYY
jgi:hypothetical protein